MAKNTYEIINYEGYKFFFKFEENPPDMLHIYARGCFYPKDAIEAWFEGTEERENLEHNRMETYTDSLGIYWLWLDQDKKTKILIISCFKRTENDATRTKR
ncbi:hypothetical protein BH11CYA1_BH11CYA1_27920 [soil metagenome]